MLAGLAGKAAGYCDECNRRINPETVKPLICARGGQVSARGAKEGQATSMEITATFIGAGNYPISVLLEPSGWQTRSGISPQSTFS